jgi:hypothetical protein
LFLNTKELKFTQTVIIKKEESAWKMNFIDLLPHPKKITACVLFLEKVNKNDGHTNPKIGKQ